MVKGGRNARLKRSEVRALSRLGVAGSELKVAEADEFTLARKAAKEECGSRTANRHR